MVQGTRGEEGREEEAEGEDQIERPRRDPNARHPFKGVGAEREEGASKEM